MLNLIFRVNGKGLTNINKYERYTKEMKKKKRVILLSVLCMLSILLTACSVNGGKTVVTCDGYEVQLGKTTVAELKEAGFTNRYSHSDPKRIYGASWENFYAMKDDVSYGTMFAGNKGSSMIEFDEGVIFEMSFSYNDPEYPVGEILVKGTNFEGYTKEKVKEVMDNAKITLDSDTYLIFEADGCKYTFSFADGSETVTDIRVNDGTEIEYVVN